MTERRDLYQEYADMMAEENGDYYNTEAFAKHLANSPVWETVDKLAEYKEKLLQRALQEIKTKKRMTRFRGRRHEAKSYWR